MPPRARKTRKHGPQTALSRLIGKVIFPYFARRAARVGRPVLSPVRAAGGNCPCWARKPFPDVAHRRRKQNHGINCPVVWAAASQRPRWRRRSRSPIPMAPAVRVGFVQLGPVFITQPTEIDSNNLPWRPGRMTRPERQQFEWVSFSRETQKRPIRPKATRTAVTGSPVRSLHLKKRPAAWKTLRGVNRLVAERHATATCEARQARDRRR